MIEAVTFVCRTQGCPWLGRKREYRESIRNLGQGLQGVSFIICADCGQPPERLLSKIAPDMQGGDEVSSRYAQPEPARQLLGMDTQGHLYFASGPFPVELHIEGEEPGYHSIVVQVPRLVRRHVGTVVRGIGAGEYHLALPEGEPIRG